MPEHAAKNVRACEYCEEKKIEEWNKCSCFCSKYWRIAGWIGLMKKSFIKSVSL